MIHRYMTRKQALEFLKTPCGTNETEVLLDYLEAIRRMIYSWYADQDFIPNVVRCFPIQCFCAPECDNCETTYHGISLCEDMQVVEAMWYQWPQNRIMLHNDWRSWSPQIHDQNTCDAMGEDVAGYYPFEYSTKPCGCAVMVKFIITKPEDDGKVIRIRYWDEKNIAREERLLMGWNKPSRTRDGVLRVEEGGVILEDDFCGDVFVQQSVPSNPASGYPAKYDGRTISIYSAGTKIPSYRRVKLTNIPSNVDQVNVRAARRYCSLTNDNDPVETDNQMVLEWAAKGIRIMRMDNASARDLQSSEKYFRDARNLLFGDKVRDRGKVKIGRLQIAPSTFANSGRLNRLNRGRW